MKVYVINLEKEIARWDNIKTQAEHISMDFERISAVYGKDIPKQDRDEFVRSSPRDGRGWLDGQIGCFLSHKIAWQKIAKAKDEYAVVLEDDMHLSAGFSNIVESVLAKVSSPSIIRLEPSTNYLRLKKPGVSLVPGERELFRLLSTSWCAGAYLIHRDVAVYLLSLAEETYQPADIFLFSYEESVVPGSVPIYQVGPAIAVQDKYNRKLNFASDIEVFNAPDAGRGEGRLFSYFKRAVKAVMGYSKVMYRD